MKARILAQYILHLQKQGALTWDSEVRIDVNGKEYDLADYMGHQMPTMHVEDWYYLLKAEIPGEDKVKLTDAHYDRMKHALGMDNKDAKGGVYEAYRNCSVYNTFNDTWEDLVRGGYAERHYDHGTEIRYTVTRKGMQAVSDETGLLIRYKLEFEPKKK